MVGRFIMLPRQGHGGVDFNSPTNYKNCSKKQYEIYVCMPPKGTIVLNKLEQYKIIQ